MLDVQQIFGRAGRPQFEDEGLGIIITQHAQLSHYLGMLTHQTPIESQFTKGLMDNLNAEIVLGGWGWLWSADCSRGVTCCAGILLQGTVCRPAVTGRRLAAGVLPAKRVPPALAGCSHCFDVGPAGGMSMISGHAVQMLQPATD